MTDETRPSVSSQVSEDSPESRLLEYLPGIYREQPALEQFLSAFEPILLGTRNAESPGLEELVAGIAGLFDPNTAPKDFLPWLAGWIGFSLRGDVDDAMQRKFIMNMVELYRWRGTRKNLIKLFELFTNREPTITESGDEHNPHYFTVLLNFSDLVIGKKQREVDRQMEIAHTLIQLEKPAHTRYRLIPKFPSFQVGSAQVGENTRLGVAEWGNKND